MHILHTKLEMNIISTKLSIWERHIDCSNEELENVGKLYARYKYVGKKTQKMDTFLKRGTFWDI